MKSKWEMKNSKRKRWKSLLIPSWRTLKKLSNKNSVIKGIRIYNLLRLDAPRMSGLISKPSSLMKILKMYRNWCYSTMTSLNILAENKQSKRSKISSFFISSKNLNKWRKRWRARRYKEPRLCVNKLQWKLKPKFKRNSRNITLSKVWGVT